MEVGNVNFVMNTALACSQYFHMATSNTSSIHGSINSKSNSNAISTLAWKAHVCQIFIITQYTLKTHYSKRLNLMIEREILFQRQNKHIKNDIF